MPNSGCSSAAGKVHVTHRTHFVPPSWEDLALSAVPPQREPEDREPGTTPRVAKRSERARGVVRPYLKPDTGIDQVTRRPRSWSGPHMWSQSTWRRPSHATCSEWCCSVVLSKFPLSLHAVADVAVHLILVATIEHLVRRRGCLLDEDMHSRASWHAPAEKLVDECEQISWPQIDPCVDGRRIEVVVDGLPVRTRRGPSGSRHFAPRWCVLCRMKEKGTHVHRAPWPASTGPSEETAHWASAVVSSLLDLPHGRCCWHTPQAHEVDGYHGCTGVASGRAGTHLVHTTHFVLMRHWTNVFSFCCPRNSREDANTV